MVRLENKLMDQVAEIQSWWTTWP